MNTHYEHNNHGVRIFDGRLRVQKQQNVSSSRLVRNQNVAHFCEHNSGFQRHIHGVHTGVLGIMFEIFRFVSRAA